MIDHQCNTSRKSVVVHAKGDTQLLFLGESKRSERRRKLGDKIEKKYYEHKRIAGSTKIREDMHADGEHVSRGLVAEIMRDKGLKSKTV